jgi:hypothetical protein
MNYRKNRKSFALGWAYVFALFDHIGGNTGRSGITPYRSLGTYVFRQTWLGRVFWDKDINKSEMV